MPYLFEDMDLKNKKSKVKIVHTVFVSGHGPEEREKRASKCGRDRPTA